MDIGEWSAQNDTPLTEAAAWYNDTNGEFYDDGKPFADLAMSDQLAVEREAESGITRRKLAQAREDFAAMANGEDSFDDLYDPW